MMKSFLRTSFVAVCLLSLAGCSNLDQTQQRVLTGGAIGTTVGAIGTVAMGGCVACGAAIGGVVGAGTGYAIDKIQGM